MRRIVVMCVVALVAAACGGAHQDRLDVGALYPLTGPQGAEGREEAQGAQLAVEWANTHGGVAGRAIRLRLVDVPRPEAVPSAMRTLREAGITVVLGTHSSAVSAVAAREAAARGMLLWETGAVGEVDGSGGGGHTFLRMAPTGANLGQAAIAFVRDQLAPRLGSQASLRYAVAFVDDPYGRAVADGALDEARSSGQVVAGAFPYDARKAEFSDVAARIADARPDVLFVSAYLDDGVALREATISAGVRLAASIGTSSSYCMPAFGDRLGPGAVGLFASDKPEAAFVRPEALGPEGRQTLAWAQDRYRQRFGANMSAPALAGFANTYALVAHVLPAAGSARAPATAAAALRTKLAPGTLANGAGLDLAPPGGPLGGTNRAAVSVIWEWVGNGQRAVVWPPAYATHPIATLPLA